MLFTIDAYLCYIYRLLQVRGRMYELLIHCIPPEVIIKVIMYVYYGVCMCVCVCVHVCVCARACVCICLHVDAAV